jgi:hypothetical protein
VVMNHLSTSVDYPFNYFNERAFSKEQVCEYAYQAYEHSVGSYYEDCVVSSGLISSNHNLYTLGLYGRICTLDEVHDPGIFSGYTPEDYSQHVIDLHNYCGGDYMEMLDYSIGNMTSTDRDKQELLRQDIAMALNMQHVFLMNTEFTYHSMFSFLDKFMKDEELEGHHPFIKENKNKIFYNIPIIEVW